MNGNEIESLWLYHHYVTIVRFYSFTNAHTLHVSECVLEEKEKDKSIKLLWNLWNLGWKSIGVRLYIHTFSVSCCVSRHDAVLYVLNCWLFSPYKSTIGSEMYEILKERFNFNIIIRYFADDVNHLLKKGFDFGGETCLYNKRFFYDSYHNTAAMYI